MIILCLKRSKCFDFCLDGIVMFIISKVYVNYFTGGIRLMQAGDLSVFDDMEQVLKRR